MKRIILNLSLWVNLVFYLLYYTFIARTYFEIGNLPYIGDSKPSSLGFDIHYGLIGILILFCFIMLFIFLTSTFFHIIKEKSLKDNLKNLMIGVFLLTWLLLFLSFDPFLDWVAD